MSEDVPPSVDLRFGDCLGALRELPDESISAVITDPPYGLEFMGAGWDGQVPGVAYWRECLRVLRPGGHLLAFGGTRTWHRLAVAIEDAGFEIRDTIMWVYGSGFPKSLDVSKAIDKAGGVSPAESARVLRAARERSGMTRQQLADAVGCTLKSVIDWEDGRLRAISDATPEHLVPSIEYRRRLAELLGYTADERILVGADPRPIGYHGGAQHGVYGDAATPTAEHWQGWGTALKPAQEPIIVARKPLAGTVAANVLAHGTGALHVDACRVAHASADDLAISQAKTPGRADVANSDVYGADRPQQRVNTEGRWPANVVLVHAEPEGEPCRDGCPVAELDRQSGITKSSTDPNRFKGRPKFGDSNYAGARHEGRERKPDEYTQNMTSGETAVYADEGGASRYFSVFRYQAKAPASERPKIDGKGWPTVKPLALMRWLVRLVTPPGGTVLDPFAGTGSTLQAARDEGFASIGIERDPFAHRLACQRLGLPEVVPEAAPVDPILAAIAGATSYADLLKVWREHEDAWTDAHTDAAKAARAQLDGAAA